MSFILKINGESTEEWYCRKHRAWNHCDDEMNCCAQEQERQLQNQKITDIIPKSYHVEKKMDEEFRMIVERAFKPRPHVYKFVNNRRILSIAPPFWIESYVDHGLIFFGSMGVVLLGLTLLEHLGIELNNGLVLFALYSAAVAFGIYCLYNTHFFTHVLTGF